jgi:hypothetical protein
VLRDKIADSVDCRGVRRKAQLAVDQVLLRVMTQGRVTPAVIEHAAENLAVETAVFPVAFDLLFEDVEHLGQIVVLRAQLAKDFDHRYDLLQGWYGNPIARACKPRIDMPQTGFHQAMASRHAEYGRRRPGALRVTARLWRSRPE